MLQNNLIDNLVIVDNSVFNFWLFLFLLLFLILISAFLSGSEVAIFGLSNTQKETLIIDEKNKNSQRIINLISDPKKLLATILIGNNLVNVAIVLVSSLMMNHIFEKYSLSPLLSFIIQVVLVTFFILLFGEVIPKVYANNYNLKFSKKDILDNSDNI